MIRLRTKFRSTGTTLTLIKEAKSEVGSEFLERKFQNGIANPLPLYSRTSTRI
jgi:hypothetical protein